jgi:hypothetical protein
MPIHRLRKRGERSYKVWVKGKRATTEQRVTGDSKDEAIWKYARYYDVKTIECDARWMRGFV